MRADDPARRSQFVRAALPILFIIVPWHNPDLSSAQPPCPPLRSEEFSERNIRDRYTNSIFKVYTELPNGKERDIGTATLIDKRGYFLTAHHILKEHGPRNKLKLKLPHLDVAIDADRHGDAANLDLLILKAQLPDYLTSYPIEPLLERPLDLEHDSVVITGYPQGQTKRYQHPLAVIGAVDAPQMFILTGTAYPAESGSPAINLKGKAVGVLVHVFRPPEAPERTKTFFTLAWEGKPLFLTLGPTDDSSQFLSALEHGSLSKAQEVKLKSAGLTNIEWAYIVEQLETDRHKYVKGLGHYSMEILEWLRCNGLIEHAVRFAANHGPKIKWTGPMILRYAHATFDLMRSRAKASRSDLNLAATYALDFFKESEQRLTGPKHLYISRRVRSDFYVEYARLLVEARDLLEARDLPTRSVPSAEFQKLQLAIRSDWTNPKPYLLWLSTGTSSVAVMRYAK